MKIRTKKDRIQRIRLRQRKRIHGTAERPRLAVYRSVAHIYAQVIDDMAGRTVAAAASTEPGLKKVFSGKVNGGNTAGAEAIGQDAARGPGADDDVVEGVHSSSLLRPLPIARRRRA